MVSKAFPKLFGLLVNLRRLLRNDAQDITRLLINHNVSKHLWDVPSPYSIKDALDFIKCAHSDFNILRAQHFAIEYKEKSEPKNHVVLVGTISLKNIQSVNKKADLGYWVGEQYWEGYCY